MPIDDVTYPLITDLADLTYLVNLNSLEMHVPQWTVDDDGERRNPDRLVIDLDPGKPAGLHECAKVALLVRDRLAALGLEMFPVTSGSKGMQLYAALGGDLTSDQVRDLAMQLAQEMTKKYPGLVLWKMTKSLRPGQGLPRLEPERRRQDDDQPLLAARPRAALRRRARAPGTRSSRAPRSRNRCGS